MPVLMRAPSFGSAVLAGLALVVAAGCKAPIPNRAEEEADAAWNASEWRDDYGAVWRVRMNSRRLSAVETTPDSGVTLRGSVAAGVLTFTVTDKGGVEIGKGEAKAADASHGLFHMFDTSGKETSHGLWHFDHAPGAAGAAQAPVPVALPSIAASPSGPAPALTAPAPVTPASDLTASPIPDPSPTSSQPPATPAKPGDPLDLRPH
jgi:hypothetical protein